MAANKTVQNAKRRRTTRLNTKQAIRDAVAIGTRLHVVGGNERPSGDDVVVAILEARDAVKALIAANEFLESEVCELMQAVSHAYVRGRFKTYTG